MENNYTDQPDKYPEPLDKCPEPMGKCPVYTPEFINKLSKLEQEVYQNRKERTERNDAYSKILDEIRAVQLDQSEQLREIREWHRDVLNALNGVMGRDGLISENRELAVRVHALENWKRDIKAFIAGGLAICSITASSLTLGLKYIIDLIKG